MEIKTTKINRPPRLVVYGPHKIGKSTFGASCPAPVFIQTEDGLQGITTSAFDLCTDLNDVFACLNFLYEEQHQHKTVIIDSLDWLEKLIFADICKEKSLTDIGEIPYGRGYSLAENIWKNILNKLEELNLERRMMVVLLAHAKIEKFEDPERENYDRYSLDLQKKGAGLVSEWADILGFASYRVATLTKDAGFGQKVVKAKSTGERILNLEERASFTAGNRYQLPAQLPFSWDAIAAELRKPKEKKENLAEVKAEKQVEVLDKIEAPEEVEKPLDKKAGEILKKARKGAK